MSPTVRSLAALLVVLALVAGLPAICACAPAATSAAGAAEHDCCMPPAGVRAVTDHDCCGGTAAAVDAIPPVAPAVAAAHAPVQPLLPDVVSATLPAFVRPALAAASPPPRVLRI